VRHRLDLEGHGSDVVLKSEILGLYGTVHMWESPMDPQSVREYFANRQAQLDGEPPLEREMTGPDPGG
jgi:hypothetical protein